MIEINGRALIKGKAEGEAVVINEISFYGDVDPETGKLKDGRSIKGKIVVSLKPRGSTVGSYIIYALKENNVSPKAIIMVKSEPIIVAGCVLANIPLIDNIPKDLVKNINDGDKIIINGDKIIVIK
ncbi:MAG: aconitase X swivel domain-containing protein [Caldisphaera sp.]|jgi:predicted aconitase with swiveling domain|nr:MAG: hypothetical protein C0171_06305 [Caldisphaera sp.]